MSTLCYREKFSFTVVEEKKVDTNQRLASTIIYVIYAWGHHHNHAGVVRVTLLRGVITSIARYLLCMMTDSMTIFVHICTNICLRLSNVTYLR